jgi:hypothetical protein
MTAGGNTISVVLGTLNGHAKEKAGPATMIWMGPTNTVNESGPADKEF